MDSNAVAPKPPDHVPPSRRSIAWDEALNPAQLAAVTHGNGPLLIIAGAGSGKTRTLIYRLARLVEDGVPPQSILLLTFTRKASREMRDRASRLADPRCRRVSGGTFHSFAHAMLRRHASKIGFDKGFSIIDRSDSEDLIGLICKEIFTPSDQQHLPRKATLAAMFSRALNKDVPLEEIILEDHPQFHGQIELLNRIQTTYRIRKRDHEFCDYDDLLVFLHQLLKQQDSVRQQISALYRHILVDEYQDTNLIQDEIISLLMGPERNVTVVGDDAQSIYAFRGASYQNIITFASRFPDTRIIKLEENYRSRQPILDLSNAMINTAGRQYPKQLFTRRQGGRRPRLVAGTSENAQSRYVVREIRQLMDSGVPSDRIAVLFRAGFHSFDLELELSRSAIPFAKVGGFKFTESAHIKDLLAHLRILFTPKDRLSWHRVLMLVEKIGAKTARRIHASVVNQGRGAVGLLYAPVKMRANASFDRLKTLVAETGNGVLSTAQTGDLVIEYYQPILEARYDDHPRRLRDLQQLLSIMERYDRIEDFLSDMALEPPDTCIEGQLADADAHDRRLTLSTIHSAKGLEWHTVFLIWALDGRFPVRHAFDRADALEEERRLMYVAATRACENLIITYPTQIYDRATQSVLRHPSRFLQEVPESLLDCIRFAPQA